MGVVSTIKDKCKRCYSCIRNCPARAIKVELGQAKVMEERCIGCGTCVRVCAQDAKKIESGIEITREFLVSSEKTIACLAPSFPAAFPEARPTQIVSALKRLGFKEVLEIAFGAELISREYMRLAQSKEMDLIVTSPCPALVFYIQRHVPQLLPFLAPIVSPMIALGRAIKWQYAPEAKVVFIGPCIAKKEEMRDPKVAGVIDAVLTYQEIKKMFTEAEIDITLENDKPFDGPHPHLARVFPISGGLLKSAAMKGDILENEIVVTEGKDRSIAIINEILKGNVKAKFYDILFCEGCINGPVMPNELGIFARKEVVVNYVRAECEKQTKMKAEAEIERYVHLPLLREFTDQGLKLPYPTEVEVREILARINKTKPEDELNCGACGYNTCREKAIAVYQGLAEIEMCLPFLIEQTEKKLGETHDELIRSERLAALGKLAAGVAHEINNPLGGIAIYANLLLEKTPPDDFKYERLKKIVGEAERCKRIVRGLLEFARQSEPAKEPLDINKLVERTLSLVEGQALFYDIKIDRQLKSTPKIMADPAQLEQVFMNIIINAAEAMRGGGTLTVKTRTLPKDGFVEIKFADTGCGIPEENLPKIFEPFFTTKEVGKGTGLGLAVSHGIIQRHRGNISVKSKVGVGTTFAIRLPIPEEAGKHL